jgi:hypothetical protein
MPPKKRPSSTTIDKPKPLLPEHKLCPAQLEAINNAPENAVVQMIESEFDDDENLLSQIHYCPLSKLTINEVDFLINNRRISWDAIAREKYSEDLEKTLSKIRHANCPKECDHKKNRPEERHEHLGLHVVFTVQVDYS